jgi:hypothetical protein
MLHIALALALALTLATDTGDARAPAPGGDPPAVSLAARPAARFLEPAPVPRWLAATPAAATPAIAPVRIPAFAADTPRAALVEYSDAYALRQTIHRVGSYAMVPLFAAQYLSGRELMNKGSDAPAWARDAHGPLATGVAALFTVNTVTGVWNLWEARKDPEGRRARTAHGLLMLLADAGFAATGLLAEEAEESGSMRGAHRTVALSSIGAALVSYAIMLPPFRR